jgi:purine-binding chemotaxis protein CheW
MVTFELDQLLCAIDATAVVEVLRAVALRPIPGQPPFIAGVIDLRGSVIPVMDLRVRFGRPPKDLVPSHRYIIAAVRALTVAVWVDRIVDVVAIPRDAIAPSEGLIVGTKSLVGVGKTSTGLVMIHDADGFLSQAEADGLLALGACA